MTIYIIVAVVSFLGGCLVTGNNAGLYNSIRKLFGK